jgi:integrase
LRDFILPRLGGERKLAEIKKPDIFALLDDVTDRSTGITANKTLVVLHAMWRFWAGRAIAEGNLISGIEKVVQEFPRDRVLDDAELLAILNGADRCGWPYGPIVQLLAATGCRRNEIAGLRWSEISETITIPRTRRKGGVSLTIPVSSAVRAIIDGLPRFESQWCFPSQPRKGSTGGHFNGWSQAKNRLDKFSGVTDWRLHDLRRTMATRLQSLGIRGEVIEAALGHQKQGIEGIYQRHNFLPEMAVAFEAWARYLDWLRHPEGPAGENVVRLRGGSA